MNFYRAMLFSAAIFLTAFCLAAHAEEVVFPVSGYTPDELVKVREWEKTWAGKKIDKSNIDQIAQFLFPPFVEVYKNPEKWGAPPEGLFFSIAAYVQIIETKGMIAATKKYAPLVKKDGEGKILNSADLAGFPFPAPKTGLEVAYNTDYQTRGDTYKMHWLAPVVDPRTRTDRFAEQLFTEMYFVHRVDVEPKPAIAKNPKGYHKAQFDHFDQPPEMQNSRLMQLKFIDESKEYESYIYFNEFRRIQRLSSTERTNAIDGTDMIYDDANMWDGYISKNTYELKGRKDLLVCRHQDMSKTKRITGQAVSNGYGFERCNTYVVEVVSKTPGYLYKKRVWYIDPETYWIVWQEVYDEFGRFWKLFCQPNGDVKTVGGEIKSFMVGYFYQDFQRNHAGHVENKIEGVGMDINPSVFTLNNLQKTY